MSKQASSKPSSSYSAINWVFVVFIASAGPLAGYNGSMEAVKTASFESAISAVELAIKLVGVMALWLGLVRVLEAGGLMYSLAEAMRPVMKRLFPDVPEHHPAMGAMLLNMSANILGLGNAATPFGLKAMVELDKLNPFKGKATNAMCLFLAINTSSVTLLPLGAIAIRAAAGSAEPANIIVPTLVATICSTLVGVTIALWLGRRDRVDREEYLGARDRKDRAGMVQAQVQDKDDDEDSYDHLLVEKKPLYRYLSAIVFLGFVGVFSYRMAAAESAWGFVKGEFTNHWLIPLLMLWIVGYGLSRGVKVYEAVTEGAKQGFEIAVKIIPFLVAILVAISMFRASGAEALVASIISPLTSLIAMPPEVLPMAILRPLSGSGAFAVMSSLVESAPNSYGAFVASTMQGSTETTFYVLAVYFGAVGVTRIRHALVAALLADITGIIVSCLVCRALWIG